MLYAAGTDWCARKPFSHTSHLTLHTPHPLLWSSGLQPACGAACGAGTVWYPCHAMVARTRRTPCPFDLPVHPNDAGWLLEGCYADSAVGRVLPASLGGVTNVFECYWRAAQYSYQYFGIQNGGECWAGNEYTLATSRGGSSACTMQCTAGGACGGNYAVSLYSLSKDRRSGEGS